MITAPLGATYCIDGDRVFRVHGLPHSRCGFMLVLEDRDLEVAAMTDVARSQLIGARRDGAALRISGEIDISTTTALTREILAAVESGASALDLTEVPFFGAAGVDALLGGRDAARRSGRRLRVTCSRQVMRSLRLCGYPDLDDGSVAAPGAPVRTEEHR
jgi:anti-anti-sigma factor